MNCNEDEPRTPGIKVPFVLVRVVLVMCIAAFLNAGCPIVFILAIEQIMYSKFLLKEDEYISLHNLVTFS